VIIINRQGVIEHVKNTVLLSCLTVALALASSTVAFAVESEASAVNDTLKLETMSVTGSRIGRALGDDSEAISVIGGKDIELTGPSHINEVLNNVPGVWLSRGNGQEHLTAIRSAVLTGPGSCGAFYFAEDGIPLRGHGFCNVNALFDTNSEQAGRIEVLRGPGTVVHGSNAVNGIINVISQAPPQQSESRISIEGGPHDYRRLKLQNGSTSGNHGYLLSVHGESDGGYKNDSGYDQQKFNLRYDYDGDTWKITSLLSGANLNQETAGYLVGKDSYKDESRKKENPDPDAYRNSKSIRYYSSFSRDSAKDLHIIITPYLRYTEMDFLQHFLPGTPNEENGERTVGLQSIAHLNSSADFTLFSGLDMELTKAYLKQTQGGLGFGPFPSGKQYDYEVDGVYTAWFIGSDWQVSENHLLKLSARYDIQLYTYNNQMVDGNTADDGSSCAGQPCRYARPSDDSNQFRNPSYHLGYIHSLNDNTDLIFNAAHGFRAPQASEMYRLQATQVDVELDEESLDSAEVGMRARFFRMQWQVLAYWMEKDDLIIRDAFVNFNGGNTISKGLEITLDWSLTDTLNWAFQGSYAKHSYDNDVVAGTEGNDLDTAPRQLFSTEVIWQPWSGALLSLQLTHQSEYFLDAENTLEYPGHTLTNLRFRQDFECGLYGVVRVSNLADVDYAERADVDFSGDYRYFVGEPRSVYLELGMSF